MILLYIIISLLCFVFGWGLYLTVGPGKEEVKS